MSEWKAKRFWKQAQVYEENDGFGIALDARPVKTPAKRTLVVPTRGFADAIAAEWDAQGEQIDPSSMPFTRSANAAIDKVATQHTEVAEMLAAYGDSDLLCYRAGYPDVLIARQQEQWDPILDWAAEVLGARLEPRSGVMHAPLDPDVLDSLTARVRAQTAIELAGFHDQVSLSGSLILAFAPTHDLFSPKAIWEI